MYTVYVLQSLKNGKRYTGITGQDVQERLHQHNNGATPWTKDNGPFKLIYTETRPDRAAAIRREHFLKSGKGRELLKERIPR